MYNGKPTLSIDEARDLVGDAVRQGNYSVEGAGYVVGKYNPIPGFDTVRLTGIPGEMPTQRELSKAFGIPLQTKWTSDIGARVMHNGD